MLKAIHGITAYLTLLYQWKTKAFDDFLNCKSLNKMQEHYFLLLPSGHVPGRVKETLKLLLQKSLSNSPTISTS